MLNFPKAPSSFFVVCLLLNLFAATANAAGTKLKADQVRPKPKTAPTRATEPDKKGKKGSVAVKAAVQAAPAKNKAAPVKPALAKSKPSPATTKQVSGKDKSQGKNLTAAHNQRNQPAAKVSSKAATPLRGKKGQSDNKVASARTDQPENNRLVSRQISPSLVSAVFVPSGQRGKFGKANSPVTRDNDEDTTANLPRNHEPKSTRRPAPARESNRNDELDDDRADQSDTAPPPRRGSEANSSNETPAHNVTLPDKIEVTEYGSTSPTLAKLLALPDARPLTPFGAVVTKGNSQPGRRNDLIIPQQRILEIQYELAKRGFYSAEPNGVYDEATVQAMWEFQKNYGLPATGYPTAHSLKRLGLTSW